jgi:hypothetical protein
LTSKANGLDSANSRDNFGGAAPVLARVVGTLAYTGGRTRDQSLRSPAVVIYRSTAPLA